MHPDRMEAIDIINIACHLGKNPFTFFSKDRVNYSINLRKAIYKLPLPLRNDKEEEQRSSNSDINMSGSEDEEEELPRLSSADLTIIHSHSCSVSSTRNRLCSCSQSRSMQEVPCSCPGRKHTRIVRSHPRSHSRSLSKSCSALHAQSESCSIEEVSPKVSRK